MDIVTDTSAIVAVVLNEPDKPTIIAQTQGAIPYAPRSLSWEIGNALSSLLRRGKSNLSQAAAALYQYEQIPLNLVEIYLLIDLLQAVMVANTYNRRDDGLLFLLKPEEPQFVRSPFAIEGVKTGLSREEILEAIHEGRSSDRW